MFSQEQAQALLDAAGVFHDYEPGWSWPPPNSINLNDALYWACADAEPVPDECLVEVATLFYRYGWSGILYWVLKRRGETRCAFADVNRAVQFVREEEAIRAEVLSDTQRAYLRRTYTLGDE